MKMRSSDLEIISSFAKNHPTGVLLSEMKNWHFQVGDTLIRLIKLSDGSQSVDLVSELCPVPKKYRVVHIDDIAIPWVKQLSVRGGLGSRLHNLATVEHGKYTYQVDPEQLEAIILGYQYDARTEYRKMREANPNYGSGNQTTKQNK